MGFILNLAIFVLLLGSLVLLFFRCRRLEERLSRAVQYAYNATDEAERAKNEWSKGVRTIHLTYTLTESDFVNFKQQTARARHAKARMVSSLAHKVGQMLDPEEVVKDGVVVGYSVDVAVRSKNFRETRKVPAK